MSAVLTAGGYGVFPRPPRVLRTNRKCSRLWTTLFPVARTEGRTLTDGIGKGAPEGGCAPSPGNRLLRMPPGPTRHSRVWRVESDASAAGVSYYSCQCASDRSADMAPRNVFPVVVSTLYHLSNIILLYLQVLVNTCRHVYPLQRRALLPWSADTLRYQESKDW